MIKNQKRINKMLSIGKQSILLLATLTGITACNEKKPPVWKSSSEISVLSREEGSGTRGAFVELVGIEQKDASGKKVDMTTEEAAITNNTSVMITSVCGDLYAIGYISLGSMSSAVKALRINGVPANAENVKNGTYGIARPFNIAIKKEINKTAQDFIRFIQSNEGQAIVEKNGYISVAGGTPFISENPSGKVVIAGSSSVSPVMEKLKEAYLKINSNAQLEIQTSDSSTGVSAAAGGICDIGMASRELKSSEIEKGLSSIRIAIDGIAVIVNTQNPIDGLAKDTVKAIYTGEILTWKNLAK